MHFSYKCVFLVSLIQTKRKLHAWVAKIWVWVLVLD